MKVGIVCDNYKVEKFKEKLEQGQLVIHQVIPYKLKKGFIGGYPNSLDILTGLKDGTSLITILCERHQIDKIAEICLSLEIKFKHNNNKN